MESIDICLYMGLAGPKQVVKCAVEHSRRHRCLYGCMVLDEQMDCGLMQQSLEIVGWSPLDMLILSIKNLIINHFSLIN